MYSFVIRIAVDVNKAVELVNTIPMLGLINDIVEVVKADPDPNNISVIINSIFFYSNTYFSFYSFIMSFLRDFNIFS